MARLLYSFICSLISAVRSRNLSVSLPIETVFRSIDAVISGYIFFIDSNASLYSFCLFDASSIEDVVFSIFRRYSSASIAFFAFAVACSSNALETPSTADCNCLVAGAYLFSTSSACPTTLANSMTRAVAAALITATQPPTAIFAVNIVVVKLIMPGMTFANTPDNPIITPDNNVICVIVLPTPVFKIFNAPLAKFNKDLTNSLSMVLFAKSSHVAFKSAVFASSPSRTFAFSAAAEPEELYASSVAF